MNDNNKLVVFILAAGSIKNRVQFLNYTFNSPALLPINTGTAASNIIDFYKKSIKNCEINLVINDSDIDEVERELQYHLKDISLIVIEPTKGINETLSLALNLVEYDCEVIINPVTTIPVEIPKDHQVFLSLEVFRNADFSLVSLTEQGVTFIKKGEAPLKATHAFTGIFRTQNILVKQALDSCNDTSDLLSVIQEIHALYPFSFKAMNWIDCGHEVNFYEAKAKLVTSRSFNSIRISTEEGLLEKNSTDVVKFKNEINYFSLLPGTIQTFFPRVVSSSLGSKVASAKFEYYGYSTMAEYMLYWDLSDAMWEKAFKSLSFPLKQFKKHATFIENDIFIDFYLTKLDERLKEFDRQLSKENKFLCKDSLLKINGKEFDNYSILKTRIERKIQSLYDVNDFCIMHGDYCFNNILYDCRSGVIKLIDPRGSFGKSYSGVYGDIKYDLAKLTHSVVGQYDYFIAKLFSLKVSDKCISYEIIQRPNFSVLKNLNYQLIEDMGYKYEDILFLTSLLFLSMVPLHSEDSDRQIALYVHGIRLLNQSLEKK